MYISNISPEELDKLKLGTFPGKIYVIDELGKDFDEAIRYLKHKAVIGFDTESRPCFSAGQPHYGVSLLQLSGAEKAYLFRIKKIGMHKKLCQILADENIIKVGAAVNDDIRGLQKRGDFKAAGFVDLQQMVGEYGIRDKSVKKMTAIIMGIRISKSQQLSNWEADHLSEAQQAYAATDAWVCREMYKRLLRSKKNPLPELIAKREEMAAKAAAKEAAQAEAAARKAAKEAARAEAAAKREEAAARKAAKAKAAAARKAAQEEAAARKKAAAAERKAAQEAASAAKKIAAANRKTGKDKVEEKHD